MFLSNPWQRLLRGTASMALVSAGVTLSACSSDKTANTSDPLSSGVVREGVTTDAALMQFLSKMPDNWGWAGGVFDTPEAGDGGTMAVISAATPDAFAWHADPTAAPNPSDVIVASEQNGQTFFLAFSVPENAKLLRVFTSLKTYTPDAATWQTLVTASQPITLSLSSGTFENDQLTPDGGPHSGQKLSLTIQ
jgi:hypothetical protein